MTVVVTIPVYKKAISYFEKCSLKQVKTILGDKYDIVFVAPMSLDVNYGKEYENIKVERFDDKYFENIPAYSSLMLSVDFYRRFAEFDYLLIYQLDAYVFYDGLIECCNLGYDYIGAPLPVWIEPWRKIKARVGNGGFSLRRIDACIRVLQEINEICYDAKILELVKIYEDVFFGYCGVRQDVAFNVAPVNIAYSFSVEYNMGHIYQKIMAGEKRLPFGCHRWFSPLCLCFFYQYVIKDQQDKELFFRHIKNKDCLESYNYGRKITLTKYLTNRIQNNRFDELYLRKLHLLGKNVVIWGNGFVGKWLMKRLVEEGIKVDCIFDASVTEEYRNEQGIVVRQPDLMEIKEKNDIVIVATTQYEKEIIRTLNETGLKKDKNYVVYGEIIDKYLMQVPYRVRQ